MTPERTAEAIAFQTSGLLTSQGYFSTSDIATQGEAQAGSVNNKLMTPLRTKEAIEALSSVVTISTTAPSDPKNGDLW